MADIELVVPLDGFSPDYTVDIPAVGKTVRLVLPCRYEEDFPTHELGEASIVQMGVLEDYDDGVGIPKPYGNFDIASYKQELFDGGRGVAIEFVVPSAVTY
jgi:hypothetical protein